MTPVSIHKIRPGGSDRIYQSYGTDSILLVENAVKIINEAGLKVNEQYIVNMSPRKRLDNDMWIYNVHNLKTAHPHSNMMCTDRLVFNIIINDPKDKDIIEASRLEWIKSGFHAGI